MDVCLLPPLHLCHWLSSDLQVTRLCVCVCAQIYMYIYIFIDTKTYLFNVVVVFLDAVTVAWCSHLNSLFPPEASLFAGFDYCYQREKERGKKATFRNWRMIHRGCLFLGFMVFRWWHQWNIKKHNIQCSPRCHMWTNGWFLGTCDAGSFWPKGKQRLSWEQGSLLSLSSGLKKPIGNWQKSSFHHHLNNESGGRFICLFLRPKHWLRNKTGAAEYERRKGPLHVWYTKGFKWQLKNRTPVFCCWTYVLCRLPVWPVSCVC